jgi:hypothetical protein
MTNNTYSTTHTPLGNVTITGGGYSLSTGSTNAIYVGGGAGGGTGIPASAHTTWATTASTMSPSSIQVKGDAEFLGNIKIKGRNLTDWLETVDSRLGLLHIDSELESEFDELRALGDAYREAERRFNEQKRVYEILKNTDE